MIFMQSVAKREQQESLLYRPVSWVDPLPLAEMFTVSRPVEVELGSGDGSFLAQWSKSCPEINFIGVERLLGRLRKLDRKARRAGLTNLRLMRIEASYFLGYLLAPRSVEALHIYFPDPWPKRKHRKHRLINEQFPALAARVLLPGGIVYLRTDDHDYFDQMQDVFARDTRFLPRTTPDELLAIMTDFERGFHARGIRTCHAAYGLEIL
jgi:tRNA (guanine-N7-)-methyltransferase